MKSIFWDERYSSGEFVYGTNPNEFLKHQLNKIQLGKVLFLGEGEGRNSVYASTLGFDVDAVDYSAQAKLKALQLAEANKTKINYFVNDLIEFDYKENFYDAVVIIYVHLPVEIRETVFNNSIKSLKKNGKIILEVFSKDQINNNSGGPKSIELLYSEDEIRNLTKSLQIELCESLSIDLQEGNFHSGSANVIRYIGVKIQ